MKKFDSSYSTTTFFQYGTQRKIWSEKGGLKSTASRHPSVWKSPPRGGETRRLWNILIYKMKPIWEDCVFDNLDLHLLHIPIYLLDLFNLNGLWGCKSTTFSFYLNFRYFSILFCHGVEKNRFTTHSNGLEGLQQSHGWWPILRSMGFFNSSLMGSSLLRAHII